MSDFVTLANFLIKLAEEKSASKEELQKILNEKTKDVFFSIGKQGRYDDLVRGIVDVDFVAVWNGRTTPILFQIRHLTFQKLQSNS